jgi:predicted AAA+ superfamily ATPase
MFIDRRASGLILNYATYFPVVCITGPRQSGKTTLIRKLFSQLPYFSFEDPDTRLIFVRDPKGFLHGLPDGAVIDEAQNVPEVFSYVQGIVDSPGFKGKFILSGSQNFLLLNKVTQTLAGRTGIVKLLPFSFAELGKKSHLKENSLILKGFYPRVFNNNIPPQLFYPNYLQTYIERDIANIKTVNDKTAFYRFLKLCAARCGQILNYSQLAVDCGISVNTSKAWISLLESSFILFLLPPWYVNISKQLIKSPKLYFYDTGLAAFLLDIKNENQLNSHYLRGHLFENLVMADVVKHVSYS